MAASHAFLLAMRGSPFSVSRSVAIRLRCIGIESEVKDIASCFWVDGVVEGGVHVYIPKIGVEVIK